MLGEVEDLGTETKDEGREVISGEGRICYDRVTCISMREQQG